MITVRFLFALISSYIVKRSRGDRWTLFLLHLCLCTFVDCTIFSMNFFLSKTLLFFHPSVVPIASPHIYSIRSLFVLFIINSNKYFNLIEISFRFKKIEREKKRYRFENLFLFLSQMLLLCS